MRYSYTSCIIVVRFKLCTKMKYLGPCGYQKFELLVIGGYMHPPLKYIDFTIQHAAVTSPSTPDKLRA